jgi:hypothetical protein
MSALLGEGISLICRSVHLRMYDQIQRSNAIQTIISSQYERLRTESRLKFIKDLLYNSDTATIASVTTPEEQP